MDDDEAALLAELRAISNRSAASRFDDGEDNNDGEEKKAHSPPKPPLPSSSSSSPPLTPQYGTSSRETDLNDDDDHHHHTTVEPISLDQRFQNTRGVVVVVKDKRVGSSEEEIKATTEITPSNAGIEAKEGKTSFPKVGSAFKGARGGPAEDEELLAELRAISASSRSADRFANDDIDGSGTPRIATETIVSGSSKRQPISGKGSEELAPLKRGGENEVVDELLESVSFRCFFFDSFVVAPVSECHYHS